MSCSLNQKILCGEASCKTCYERSFATHPRASCWSSQNEFRAIQVTKSSNKKYKFDCGDCGHEIQLMLCNITKGQWCKYCNRDGICEEEDCIFCYQKSFASHPMAKSWSARNDTTPRQILRRSDKKIWFDCVDCKHLFEVKLSSISNDKHCSYCSNQTLCDREDCTMCFEKSCASHEMNKAWSDNNDIQSRQVFLQSNKKIKFDCLICHHVYETTPNHYYNRDNQCSYCSNRKLCEKEDCKTCFENSFASQEWSYQWSEKNGDVNPRQVFKYSNTKYWFNCVTCCHEFESGLNNVTVTQSSSCPYCSNPPKQLCENEDCQTCFEKSFASHEKSKYWSVKNDYVKPRQVFKSSTDKYWFNCDTCSHQFNSILNNITGKKSWCPICVNKTEKKIYEQLLQSYPNIISQFRADWCKSQITSRILPFDFVLEEQKIIIELDGNQHFVQVRNWKTPEEQFENDQYKEKCANENGYSIIRIIQEDVWNDTYDWFDELTQNIIKITSENTIQNIYMGKKNEYKHFN